VKFCISLSLFAVVAGCATTPPPVPPTPLTAVEAREQRIQQAVALAYRAGQDGLAVSQSLHRMWCQRDAQQIADRALRSAELQQCNVDWPQPQRAQVVTTNCVNYGTQVTCQSQ
jgi:hypothetical protein